MTYVHRYHINIDHAYVHASYALTPIAIAKRLPLDGSGARGGTRCHSGTCTQTSKRWTDSADDGLTPSHRARASQASVTRDIDRQI
jgi:hypothetical protein